MRSNDFDKLAFVYDRLAQLVFGKSVTESQQFFLSKVQDRSHVLILGGGSGQVVEKLFEVRPAVEICYIEASSKMLSLAKSRLSNDNRIQFVHGTENDIPNHSFDAVITNFYLDLFPEASLKIVLGKIKMNLTPNASWVVTDFVDHRWWHRIMLAIMYLFFKITSRIEADRLPNWHTAIQKIGGRKSDSKFFCHDFIETAVFQF